jgi:hypothetical protein
MQKDFIECRQCGRVSFLKNFDVNKCNDKKVVCDCGVVYCVDCKLRVHLPLTCEEKRMFTSKDNGKVILKEIARCVKHYSNTQIISLFFRV